MSKKIVVTVLLCAFVVILASSVFIEQSRKDYTDLTEVKIKDQETKLAELSAITNRDASDPQVGDIIKDCSIENRGRFDELLAKLSELNGVQLREIEQLFNACGNFYAVQKAVMVIKLQHEYDVYVDLVEILSLVDSKAKTVTYKTEDWKRLIDLEVKRSELSTQLVNIQGEIIRALVNKVTIASDDMQELLVAGQETKDALLLLSSQINDARAEILAL